MTKVLSLLVHTASSIVCLTKSDSFPSYSAEVDPWFLVKLSPPPPSLHWHYPIFGCCTININTVLDTVMKTKHGFRLRSRLYTAASFCVIFAYVQQPCQVFAIGRETTVDFTDFFSSPSLPPCCTHTRHLRCSDIAAKSRISGGLFTRVNFTFRSDLPFILLRQIHRWIYCLFTISRDTRKYFSLDLQLRIRVNSNIAKSFASEYELNGETNGVEVKFS